MENETVAPPVMITEKGEKKLKSGHVWVFADEMIQGDEGLANGSLCTVISKKQKFLGVGFLPFKVFPIPCAFP